MSIAIMAIATDLLRCIVRRRAGDAVNDANAAPSSSGSRSTVWVEEHGATSLERGA
jgi:hypothetical protein